jgi:23S rRNA (cytidine1920-2'-O)/16S rRNA (cytidine1409-2'-O)-methyltransferase
MADRSLVRLDKLLVRRGLASSRGEAEDLIKNGRVKVFGFSRDKPSSMFEPEVSIEVADNGEKRWVGRGAYKLIKALDKWNIDPLGWNCADIGASTGGFTQVLLERGAARVAAVDVGYGQLAWELRNDPRVRVIERMNARYITRRDIGWASSLVTVDASFISLRSLLPNLCDLTDGSGAIIALVKPQFEVGRARVSRGVVRDPALHVGVLEEISSFAREKCGLSLADATYSPIRGSDGNIEFIFFMTRNDASLQKSGELGFAALVEEAHSLPR